MEILVQPLIYGSKFAHFDLGVFVSRINEEVVAQEVVNLILFGVDELLGKLEVSCKGE